MTTQILAPHSIEAEEALLGAIIINPDVLTDVSDIVSVDDFFLERHKWIYATMQRIVEDKQALDNVVLVEYLRAEGKLDLIGGAAYITYLVNSSPAYIHFETYARLIQRLAVRRNILALADTFARNAIKEDMVLEDIVRENEIAYSECMKKHTDTRTYSLKKSLSEAFKQTEKMFEGERVGMPFGIKSLDEITNGIHAGNVVTFGAGTGVGKTALMLQVALNAARFSQQHKLGEVVIISLEMPHTEVTNRLIACASGIDLTLLTTGKICGSPAHERYIEALSRIENLPITICDGGMTIQKIRDRVTHIQREKGIALVIVDYIQRVKTPLRKNSNRSEEIGLITFGLKEIALDLRIPILTASQLNRAGTATNAEPTLNDLKESSSIEQDADMVIFIHRQDPTSMLKEQPYMLIVAKNRHGMNNLKVKVSYNKSCQTFSDMGLVTGKSMIA